MAFWGKSGSLSSLDAALASLREIDAGLTEEELEYLRTGDIDKGYHPYDRIRLSHVIMGLQRVVLRNNGSLFGLRMPVWEKSREDSYFDKHGVC